VEKKMARVASGLPSWVKAFIWGGILAVLAVGLLMAFGHGPWQHGAGGMHG
jgi:hypothetical protein